ncbi:hypothetical protein [Streptomyces sp. NRRL S-350]|uniref:hypothetical protein n=1 Tax=Streptomyces sp. NRRL S-350 TaxID=1463902 RepID=UPI0004C0A847|nr:hypothetical protein [Streptomyces sp. NRRL S-350]
MYEIRVSHPALISRTFTAKDGGELRNLVWAVARAAGQPIGDGEDREMVHEVGDLRSRADIEGVGVLDVRGVTVRVMSTARGDWEECEGHDDNPDVGLGETDYCDGTCVVRPIFGCEDEAALAAALA